MAAAMVRRDRGSICVHLLLDDAKLGIRRFAVDFGEGGVGENRQDGVRGEGHRCGWLGAPRGGGDRAGGAGSAE